jgi:hypothetical protein
MFHSAFHVNVSQQVSNRITARTPSLLHAQLSSYLALHYPSNILVQGAQAWYFNVGDPYKKVPCCYCYYYVIIIITVMVHLSENAFARNSCCSPQNPSAKLTVKMGITFCSRPVLVCVKHSNSFLMQQSTECIIEVIPVALHVTGVVIFGPKILLNTLL